MAELPPDIAALSFEDALTELERIVRALAAADALAKMDEETNGSRRTKKYRLPGEGSARFYVIDPDRLENDVEGRP